MNTLDIMMALCRMEISEGEPSEELVGLVKTADVSRIFDISDAHDVSQTVASALVRLGVIDELGAVGEKFTEAQEMAFYRYRRLDGEVRQITEALTKAGISYIPLKGSMIRALYPEPWMRMSNDIDILVPESELDRAVALIQSELGYSTTGKRSFHDVSMYSPGGVHLELHFCIRESMLPKTDGLLDSVWSFASPSEENRCEYEMKSEFFIAYLLIHMAQHFLNGGCGIKPFSDFYIWRKKVGYDEATLLGMLEKCELTGFYRSVCALVDVWFLGAEHTSLTREMESHTVLNGVFKVMNRVAVGQSKSGSRAKYLFSRAFMPYSDLKRKYPVVGKCPILLPIFEVVRWVEFLFKKDKSEVARELSSASKLSGEKMNEVLEFLDRVGLKQK